MYWPKWYKTGSDYTKIDLQLWDIRLVLQDLKSRLVFCHLRLKHAVLVLSSKQEKAELRFQKRILDEHIKQIDKLLEENECLKRDNFKKEYGESYYDFDC